MIGICQGETEFPVPGRKPTTLRRAPGSATIRTAVLAASYGLTAVIPAGNAGSDIHLRSLAIHRLTEE
jgi:hypothetical protein